MTIQNELELFRTYAKSLACKLDITHCAYRKLNPNIVMVQSAQDRMADNASGCFVGA
jgi:hypothetical protein